jgi:hypothetical protein
MVPPYTALAPDTQRLVDNGLLKQHDTDRLRQIPLRAKRKITIETIRKNVISFEPWRISEQQSGQPHIGRKSNRDVSGKKCHEM